MVEKQLALQAALREEINSGRDLHRALERLLGRPISRDEKVVDLLAEAERCRQQKT